MILEELRFNVFPYWNGDPWLFFFEIWPSKKSEAMGRTKFFDGDILKVEGIGWWDHPTILPSGWPHWGSFHSKVGQCPCFEKLCRGHRSKWSVLKSVCMCWFVLGYEFETHLKKPKEWIDPRTTCLDLWKRPLFAFQVTMLKLHELTGWLCSHLTGYSCALGEPLWFSTLDFGPKNSTIRVYLTPSFSGSEWRSKSQFVFGGCCGLGVAELQVVFN